MAIKYLGTDALAHLCSLIKSALAGKAASSHKHGKADITDFPASLKNPQALKVNVTSGSGATSKTYDGSSAQTVDINTTPGANGGVAKTDIVQNTTTTATDKVLSAAAGKNLQDQITQLNTNMPVAGNYDVINEGYVDLPYTANAPCRVLITGTSTSAAYQMYNVLINGMFVMSKQFPDQASLTFRDSFYLQAGDTISASGPCTITAQLFTSD